MMAKHSETERTDEEEIQNDDVVGKALKWSAMFLVLGAVVVGAALILTRKPDEVVQDVAPPTAIPQVRDRPQVEIPNIPFTEVTSAAGIGFRHQNGAAGEKLLPETMGGGGAFLDFDNDGDQDLLCVNSRAWETGESPDEQPATSALYANDGTGQFTNVTAGSGLDISLYGNGCACGDVDNDGDVDIFVSCLGKNVLFRNDGNGKFVDVTAAAGVAGEDNAWSTSCGFVDIDLDGDLDLFVCNYIQWDRQTDLGMNFTLDGKLRAYGRPTDFRGAFPCLYLNDGTGVFSDHSQQSGVQVTDPNTGVPMAKSLGVIFPDLNADGYPDIMVANDTVQNFLFLSQADGTFVESAASSGVAYDNAGAARGAMGLDYGCFRNTDSVGIAIGNFATEMTALYVCQTPGTALPVFRDEAVSNGIGPVTRTDLKFGVLFLDMDLDGRQDLVENNGHLEEDIQLVQSSQQYEQAPHLLWNCGAEQDNEFVMLTEAQTSTDFRTRMVGRGLTAADIDGDGDLDLMLFSSGGVPRLLRNEQQLDHHWLRVRLQGRTCNRDAIGAMVQIELPNGAVLTRSVMPTRSYQSQVELPVTFGLGKSGSIDRLTITWPGGQQQVVESPEVNQLLVIEQQQESGN
jgi:hypothetical protein